VGGDVVGDEGHVAQRGEPEAERVGEAREDGRRADAEREGVDDRDREEPSAS